MIMFLTFDEGRRNVRSKIGPTWTTL